MGEQDTRYRQRKWLRQQLIDEGRNLKSIAEECGVSTTTIRYWREKNGIEIEEKEVSPHHNREWLLEEYCEKDRTAADIAEECGVSHHTIYNYVQEFDLTNTQKGSKKVSCGWCGEEFNKPWSRYKEDNRHYCSKDCFRAAMSNGEIDTHPEEPNGRTVECEWCEAEVYKHPIDLKKQDHHFCSQECFDKAQEAGVIGTWGANRDVECEWCGDVVEKKLSELDGHERHFCSPECHNEWQGRNKKEFVCETCKDTFRWSPSRTKKHNPTYCSIECRNKDNEFLERISVAGNKALQEMDGPTEIEKIGYDILDHLGVDYESQEVVGEKFCVDALVEDEFVVEWDGNYWHGHPNKQPLDERQENRKIIDNSKDAYLSECGFTVVRIWGSDLRERSEKVRRLLKKVLEGEREHESGQYLIKTGDCTQQQETNQIKLESFRDEHSFDG